MDLNGLEIPCAQPIGEQHLDEQQNLSDERQAV